jgi:predicted small secreted protein
MKVKFFIGLLIAAVLVAGCNSTPKAGGDILSSVQDARQSAITAGAGERYPETMTALDASLADSQSKKTQLQDLLWRYLALEQASAAAYKKGRVDGLGFAGYDEESYRQGEESLAKFDAADRENGRASDLFNTAKTANDSYGAVLIAGFSIEADKARGEALAGKAKAEDVKADIAAKDAYAGAGEYFSRGDENIEKKLPEAALADFQIARVAYEEIHEEVLRRRETAREAIARAEQRAKEVEEFAAEADTIAPLDGAQGGAE